MILRITRLVERAESIPGVLICMHVLPVIHVEVLDPNPALLNYRCAS